MNYGEQERFLGRYRVLAGAGSAGLVALFAVAAFLARTEVGLHALAVSVLLVAATLYALWYLPLYLRLTIERRKRYAWSVRARWIALVLLAVVTAPIGGARDSWLAWFGALLLGAVFSSTLRGLLKGEPEADEFPLLPLHALAGELAIVLLVAGTRTAPLLPLGVALGLALVLFALVAGRERYAAGLALGAVGLAALFWLTWPATPLEVATLSVYVVGVAVLAVGLVRRVDERHRVDVAETVDQLSSFALVSPEQAEELLATATGILARSWNENPPVGPSATARWYEENSEYYLFDLAQFHLAYKHIAFMIDVVSLAHGRTLDYGAGIGDLALELSRRGHDSTYLDVDGRTKSFAAWRAERDWLPVTFVSSLDEVEGEFDTILSLDVFEHLAEPEPVIDALVDRLAPGGRMIVTAYFGATKAHPMHFDHDLDLGAFLAARGLVDAKSFAMRHLRSEFLGKRGVLVYEKPMR